uniref:C2H2-type domain-containing protein n=1 Tax=Pseudonaja textilis TaxID=8673 RepID=A0A670XZU0_PSETE
MFAVSMGLCEISSKGFPKTSTYWQQKNPCTPGVYVPARLIYNPASQEEDVEYQCFDIYKDLHGQREEEENFIILVDSNEEKNISPQLGKTLPSHYQKLCHKVFRKPNLLSKHKVIHRQEKPYKCKECGMAFVQLARLKRHNLTHTGERPFSCERCNNTFTRLGSLQRHQRIHTGEKPYSCSYCGVSFTDSGTLKRHEQIHKVIQI